MPELLNLKGRVAMVTGAGQGVGRQVALYLAQHGAPVVVNDYFGDRAESVAHEIEQGGGRAVSVQADVTQHGSVTDMLQAGERALGPIDILVNNAGNAGPSASTGDGVPFWETDPTDWAKWIDVNFLAVLTVSRTVLPGMVQRNYGRIVTIISDAGRVGEPHVVAYSAAKAAAAGATRAIAKAVGPHGITANCVALGAVSTPTTAPLLDNERVRSALLRNYTIKRVGQPEDPAGLVVLLCSDAASWITGQTYPVNGGYSFAL